MDIYVLLKQDGKGGNTFHGVTTKEEASDTWVAGGELHWTYLFSPKASGTIVQVDPITPEE